MNKEKRKTKSEKRKTEAGFTLLFASLIVSLLLAVGLAILDITFQQYLLSSAGRESQFAFYNADSGIECSIYYDKKAINGKHFATSSTALLDDPAAYYQNGDSISCDGKSGTIRIISADPDSAVTSFDIILDPAQCSGAGAGESFDIRVFKTRDANDNFTTTIQSRGYNTCNINNKQRVERGLQADY